MPDHQPSGHYIAGPEALAVSTASSSAPTGEGEATVDAAYLEKLRSLSFARPSARSRPRVTTDVHDHHTVEVTEHWNDRQDVTVKPEPIRIKPKGVVHGD